MNEMAVALVLGIAIGVMVTIPLAHKDAEDGSLKTPWGEFQCTKVEDTQ